MERNKNEAGEGNTPRESLLQFCFGLCAVVCYVATIDCLTGIVVRQIGGSSLLYHFAYASSTFSAMGGWLAFFAWSAFAPPGWSDDDGAAASVVVATVLLCIEVPGYVHAMWAFDYGNSALVSVVCTVAALVAGLLPFAAGKARRRAGAKRPEK